MKNEARRALWTDHIQQWRDSGLSQRAYARLHGLRARQMSYWTMQLAEPSHAAELVPVSVKRDVAASAAPALMLHSPGGWSVAIPPNVSAAWLGEMLQSLR